MASRSGGRGVKSTGNLFEKRPGHLCERITLPTRSETRVSGGSAVSLFFVCLLNRSPVSVQRKQQPKSRQVKQRSASRLTCSKSKRKCVRRQLATTRRHIYPTRFSVFLLFFLLMLQSALFSNNISAFLPKILCCFLLPNFNVVLDH